MIVNIELNGKQIVEDIEPDMLLIDFVRKHKCYSVKRGCETSNCGLCTVFVDDLPILSCSTLAARVNGKKVTTLEGIQEEAEAFGAYIADEGAEQCGFCNPGLMMNAIALLKEYEDPTDDEIKVFLSGNLCRCSGYEGQLRGIKKYIAFKKGEMNNG
jgi:carbon-monoxide dehydrogenase small subunit